VSLKLGNKKIRTIKNFSKKMLRTIPRLKILVQIIEHSRLNSKYVHSNYINNFKFKQPPQKLPKF